MDPATLALIVKGITLGADMLGHSLANYNANRDLFSLEDQAEIKAALGALKARGDIKQQEALAALDAAST